MTTLAHFQQELYNDPALERQFAACTSSEQAVALAMAMASVRGYTLDASEVAHLFDTPLTPLTDEELASVGGGSTTQHNHSILNEVQKQPSRRSTRK
jgi:hypothetical protein